MTDLVEIHARVTDAKVSASIDISDVSDQFASVIFIRVESCDVFYWCAYACDGRAFLPRVGHDQVSSFTSLNASKRDFLRRVVA